MPFLNQCCCMVWFSCLYEKALTVWTGKCSLCHSRVGGNPA
ncbi:hypothetical protein [Rickettsia asembonensis]|nr:hypothetical protein [Rickettsia asembonensis]